MRWKHVAIQMRLDYETNPSEMSGSVVVFHENSELLEEEDNGQSRMAKS